MIRIFTFLPLSVSLTLTAGCASHEVEVPDVGGDRDESEMLGPIEADESEVAWFDDSEQLRQEVAIYLADNGLEGEFSLDQEDGGGWLLTPVQVAFAEEESPVGEPMWETVDGPPPPTTYWNDIATASKSSSYCSARVDIIDDITYSSYSSGRYSGGANDVYGLGQWSGCVASGGSLILTQTVYGSSLSAAVGLPSGVTITAETSTRIQWNYTVTASSSTRRGSINVCWDGPTGSVSSRTTTATLYFYSSSSSLRVLSKSASSTFARDYWATSPAC